MMQQYIRHKIKSTTEFKMWLLLQLPRFFNTSFLTLSVYSPFIFMLQHELVIRHLPDAVVVDNNLRCPCENMSTCYQGYSVLSEHSLQQRRTVQIWSWSSCPHENTVVILSRLSVPHQQNTSYMKSGLQDIFQLFA